MPQTQYEIHAASLDQGQVTKVIKSPSSGDVIAQGVTALYAKAPTPCAAEYYPMGPSHPHYVFTDALTGCAGLIAVSGDLSASGDFIPSQALVVHDKGGDRLASSYKLLDNFIRTEQQTGHSRMRLFWGNGVEREATAQTHAPDTARIVGELSLHYPHLDIKKLPGQMVLVVDKQGNPINLTGTALRIEPMMEEICQGEPSPLQIEGRVDLSFDRPFQRAPDSTPVRPVATTASAPVPADEVSAALSQGKFPPIWLTHDPNLKRMIENTTSTIPRIGDEGTRYKELAKSFEQHPSSPLLQAIGAQLAVYNQRFLEYDTPGRGADSDKALLMSRKWWALLCMASELKDGLAGQPVRKQLLDKEFFKEHIPHSMDGHFSKTTAKLVERADR